MNDTKAVGGLVALFGASLYVVYRLEDPVLWLLWAVAMVATSGGALVVMNR